MTEREREATVSTLVSGIVTDIQELARKEIALARQEIKEDLNEAKEAGIKLGIGIGVLAVGGLFLLVTLALGLADLLDWPAWAGFGIVGLVFAIAGYFLFSSAQKQAKNLKPMPEKTIETMKENVEWIRDRTSSDRT